MRKGFGVAWLWVALAACPKAVPPPPPPPPPVPECAPAACAEEARQRESKNEIDQALTLHQRACEGDVAASCARVAALTTDVVAAQRAREKGCALNDVDACVAAAEGLARAADTMENEARLAGLYGRACDADRPAACAHLGAMRRDGRGGPRDLQAAAGHYLKACRLGVGDGCVEAFRAKAASTELGRSIETAAALYEISCEKKDPLACFQLSELFDIADAVIGFRGWRQKMCDKAPFLCAAPRRTAAELEVAGGEDKVDVARVVDKHRRGVELCLRVAGEGSAAPARIKFRIEPNGRVQKVELLEPNPAESDTAECIEGVLRQWRFDEEEQPTEVTWTVAP